MSRLNKFEGLDNLQSAILRCIFDRVGVLSRITKKEVEAMEGFFDAEQYEEIKKYCRIQNDYVLERIRETSRNMSEFGKIEILRRMKKAGIQIGRNEI